MKPVGLFPLDFDVSKAKQIRQTDLFKKLRPELVMNYHKPLCNSAFFNNIQNE